MTHPANTPASGGDVSLAELHAANIARQAEWCPDQVPDLSFRGNELGGECGEAQNVIKKLERERLGWRGSRATVEQLAEELADVVICADLCAVTAGIDLGAAVVAKFNATSEKVGLTTKLAAIATQPPKPDGKVVRHGIYMASKTSHAPRWRSMREHGLPIISTWIDEAGKGETACFTDLWRRCVAEAAGAAALIVYREADEVLKGAFVEVGAALAAGVPVFAVGCNEFSFVNHAGVTRCVSIEHALNSALAAAPPLNTGPEVGGGGEDMAELVLVPLVDELGDAALDLHHTAPSEAQVDRLLRAVEKIIYFRDAYRVGRRAMGFAKPAPAEAGEDLAGLSAGAPKGEWHPDYYDVHDEDGGPTEMACEGIVSYDDGDDAGQIATCNERVAKFICAVVNAYRSGRLTPAASRPAVGRTDPSPTAIEAMAEHLLEEDYRNYTWPAHEGDEGYRGDGGFGYVAIAPPDVQAELREKAKRILIRAAQIVLTEEGAR